VPDDADAAAWELDVKGLQKDYDGVLKLLDTEWSSEPVQRRWRAKADDYRVRCLVKLGRADEAVRTAEAGGKRGNAVMRVLAHAAQGGPAAALAAMDEAGAPSWVVDNCYRDPDLGPLLRGAGFEAFRVRYPERKQ
jgi:hypothetical protein